MLPYEIEPFAQAHIEALEDIRSQILDTLSFSGPLEISRKRLESWEAQMHLSANALRRFQVCMTDETNQKESLKKVYQYRLKYQD